MNWRGRIVATADTLCGKPRVRDTRIAVELILDCIAGGSTIEEVLISYPQLAREDVLAALGFAADFFREESRLSRERVAAWLGASEESASAEIRFVVEEAQGGRCLAKAVSEDVFTEAEGIADLHAKLRDAVRCHFGDSKDGKALRRIRMHFVRDEVIDA